MAGPTPPSPGVGNIGGSNAGKGEASQRQALRGGRRLRRGEDALKNPEAGRKIATNSQLPPGVKARVPTDIREYDIAHRQRSRRNTKTYDSVDGQTYTFRTRDNKGNPLESRLLQCLYLAVREQRLGGDPFTVFDAFGLSMEDMDGQVVFPVPDNILAALGHVERVYEDEVSDEPEDDNGFSLGD